MTSYEQQMVVSLHGTIGLMRVDNGRIQKAILLKGNQKTIDEFQHRLEADSATGFLCVKEKHLDTLEPPFLDMHAAEWTHTNAYTIRTDARKFETWETNYSNKIGLTTAVNYALDWGLENIWERISTLSKALRSQLASIPGITLRDPGENKCGIVTFTSTKMEPNTLKAHLNKKGINVSVSALNHARLDFEDRHLTSVVRASLHYYNTLDEIDHFCAELDLL